MRSSGKRSKISSIHQADLFSGISPLKTRVITRRNEFDEMFEGFEKMLAISYVVSPVLLLEMYERLGYMELEVIVGENLAAIYKHDLEQSPLEITDRLESLLEKGSLRIFTPTHTIHTKLYILSRPDMVRIIQTSANLTLTAQEARRQTNYAWYLDMPVGNPLIDQLTLDYRLHLQTCNLFMGDLKDLLARHPDEDRSKLINAWLKDTGVQVAQHPEISEIFHQMVDRLSDTGENTEEKITLLHLPQEPQQRKRVERQLAGIKPDIVEPNQIKVDKKAFIRYVFEKHRIPLLLISKDKQKLLLGIDGSLLTLNAQLPETTTVNQALQSIESYISSVDFAETTSSFAAKTSMFEALIYMFFSPFASDYMKEKREKYGLIDTRGPRFLYIYGPSQNGKTTFLRYSLKLMTGKIIEALSPQDFSKTRIMSALATETAFPLVFDDVDPSRTSGIEDVFKSYWERWWKNDHTSPQIVIASNTPRLKEWAKSRVKRIDFDVHFAPDSGTKESLAKLFAEENNLFRWFSQLYLKRMAMQRTPSEDELKTAREVMVDLYGYAKRPFPSFFPTQPIEKLYDPGRKDWQDLLYNLHKANIRDEGKRKLVTFTKDMQPWEINDYQSYLPQTVKHLRRGNTIIVENPKEFEKWLGQSETPRLFSKLFRKSSTRQ